MSRDTTLRSRFVAAISLLSLFTLPWLAITAHAAEDCAGDSTQLIHYLNVAESQTTPYKIKVLAGNYVLAGATSQWLVSTSLTLEGGYTDCNSRGTSSAAATIIDASALSPGLSVNVTSGNLRVDGFTVVGGAFTAFGGGNAGYGSGTLTISHVRLTQTHAALSTNNGSMSIDDLLIDQPRADDIDHCSAWFGLFGDNSSTWKFASIQTNQNEDVCFESDGTHNSVKVYNSIAWPGNIRMDAGNWHAGDTFDLELFNSLFNQVVQIDGTHSEQDSLHVDPLWANPGSGDFTLQVPPSPISPAINVGAGAAQVPGGISSTDTDIAGNPRVVGSAPDMGAYESAVDDGSLFAVTTTSDCATPGCGSLREAILEATAPTATAPVKTIKFWIIDWMNQPICPAVISVGSSLPNITTNVVIDGYSQASIDEIDPPLSWENTDPYAFNASLCVNIIGPGSGVAFRVPAGSNGSLTLRGVGLGGFMQGVMLLGGANHQIAGNQFGGVTSNGINLFSLSIHAINVSPNVQPSGALIIGGDNPADRNVILNAVSLGLVPADGIHMDPTAVSDPAHCQIVGNFVGVVPSGLTTRANDYGLVLDGDGCTIRNNWIAGNTVGAAWVQGQHYVLSSNYIGVAPLNPFVAQDNGGFGILVNGSNNVVGASGWNWVPPTLFDLGFGNYVSDFQDSGIVVTPQGTGNTLRGNLVVHSGTVTGNPAIDLGDDGPTANDAADADTGANTLQNFPQPHGIAWTALPALDASVNVTLETQPGLYNLDVYLGGTCDAHGRGVPGVWVGSHTVSIDAATGPEAFTVPAKVPTDYFDPTTAAISLMATNLADGSTSEIGTCMSIDTIFKDGLER